MHGRANAKGKWELLPCSKRHKQQFFLLAIFIAIVIIILCSASRPRSKTKWKFHLFFPQPVCVLTQLYTHIRHGESIFICHTIWLTRCTQIDSCHKNGKYTFILLLLSTFLFVYFRLQPIRSRRCVNIFFFFITLLTSLRKLMETLFCWSSSVEDLRNYNKVNRIMMSRCWCGEKRESFAES